MLSCKPSLAHTCLQNIIALSQMVGRMVDEDDDEEQKGLEHFISLVRTYT